MFSPNRLNPITRRMAHVAALHRRGIVKLLRLRRSSGEWVPLPSPPDPLGGPLRVCNFGPTLESLPHLLTIVGG